MKRKQTNSQCLTRLILPAGLLAVSSSAIHGAPLEAVFQQGRSGYTGAADTYISKSTWQAGNPQNRINYGRVVKLELSRNGTDNPLLRFDLSMIPSHSVIVSAKLELYHTSANVPAGMSRTVDLFRVTTPWIEGTNNGKPITAAGQNGATGLNAAEYSGNEGQTRAWSANGMAGGADFDPAAECHAAVQGTGWQSWDITALVSRWVRGTQPNHGVTLRDRTGYQLNNPDARTFHSADYTADPALRPRLVIVYNPGTPVAAAGLDSAELAWTPGGSITIDGSASHDHPGGDNATLRYSWRLKKAAYGSALQEGMEVGTGAILTFPPDAAGDYIFELIVTNAEGETSVDEVKYRVWKEAPAHPRIYLTPERLAGLRAKAAASNPRWVQLKANADNPQGEMRNKALAWQITGNAAYATAAINAALARMADSNNNSTKAADLALIFDWCHDRLTPEQHQRFVAWFEDWAAVPAKLYDEPGWGNYWPRWSLSWALTGIALQGHSPAAQAAMEKFRDHRWVGIDVPLHDRIADGGHWPEGPVYDWIANYPKVMAMAAWKNVTGEDLFRSTDWFRQRFGSLLLQTWPGIEYQWGRPYRLYPALGDAERYRHSIQNYGRASALVLGEQFPDEPLARQMQATLSGIAPNTAMGILMAEEFIYFDENRAAETPSLTSHFSPSTGNISLRSGWPKGGVDDDRNLTHATFQSGDHFSYHQHFDQNSFTLYKGGDLLIDSGVYSGEGTSYHDVDYYVRTIAHNTLVVRNPTENFSSARPRAERNDGGQRTFVPASRSPSTLEYFDANYQSYQRGKITRYSHAPSHTYAVGDATRAYNSTLYNQAQDTVLTGNTAKVSRFVREFLYLRDPDQAGASTDEKVILVDRVGVTKPEFSGSSTKLLFHTLNEPAVGGAAQAVSPGETLYPGAATAVTEAGNGQLVFQFMNASHNIRKVGGRNEKSFWVFDDNVDWHWSRHEAQPRPRSTFDTEPYGEWRLELEPATRTLDHVFVTVLHPRLKTDAPVELAQPVTGNGVTGVRIPRSESEDIVLFSSAMDGAAPQGAITVQVSPDRAVRVFAFNLEVGRKYDAAEAGGMLTLTPSANGSWVVGQDGSVIVDLSAN